MCVSFDAAIKCPMTLVEGWFKKPNIGGRPVELIPYPEGGALKVFTGAIVKFDPAFDPNIIIKSQTKIVPMIV